MLPKKIEKLPGLSNVTGRYTKKSPYESYSSTHSVSTRIPISASSNSVKKSAVRSTSEEVVPSLFNSTYNKRNNESLKSGKTNRLVSSTSLSPSRYEVSESNTSDYVKKRPNNISSPSWSSSLSNASNNVSLSPCSASPSVHYLSKFTSSNEEDEGETYSSKKSSSSNIQIRPAGIIKPQVVGGKTETSMHRNYQLPKKPDEAQLLPGLIQTQRILTQYIPYLLPDAKNMRHGNYSFPHSDSNLSNCQDDCKTIDSEDKGFEKQLKCLEYRLMNIILQEDQSGEANNADDATPRPKTRSVEQNMQSDEILKEFSKTELDHLLQAVRVLLCYQSTNKAVISDRENQTYQSVNKSQSEQSYDKSSINSKVKPSERQPGNEAMIKQLPIGFQNFSRYLDNKFGPDAAKGERNDTPLVGRHRMSQKLWPENESYMERKISRDNIQKVVQRQNSTENPLSSSSLRRTQSEPEHGDILLANQINEIKKNFQKHAKNKISMNINQIYDENFIDEEDFAQNHPSKLPTIIQPTLRPPQNPVLYHSHSATGYHSLPENTYYPNQPYISNYPNRGQNPRNHRGDLYEVLANNPELYNSPQSRYDQNFYPTQNAAILQDGVCMSNLAGNSYGPPPIINRANGAHFYGDRGIQQRVPIMQNYPINYGRPLTRSGSSITPGSIKNFLVQNRYGAFVPMVRNYDLLAYPPAQPQHRYPTSSFLYPPSGEHQLDHDDRGDHDSSPVVCMISNSLSATDLAAMQSSSLTSGVNSSSTDNLNNLVNRRALTPSIEFNQTLYGPGMMRGQRSFEMETGCGGQRNRLYQMSAKEKNQRLGDLAAQGGYIINNIAPQDPLLTLPNQNSLYSQIQNLLEKEMTTNFPLTHGWSQQRTNTGRMFYAYSGQDSKFRNLIETMTWDHPVISPQIPFCWERVDTIREGVYYRNMLIPHCQRHHPNLWMNPEMKNTGLEKSQWFLELCDLQNSLKLRIMNGLMPIVDKFKNNHDENDEMNYLHHFKCMEYGDLVNVLHHLDRLFYMELRDLIVRYERRRFLIAESMFMQKPVREIFANSTN